MNHQEQTPPSALPCLRGQVQDWIYYVTLMRFKEIALRFKPAEEIHKNKTLNELLQRALDGRSVEIGDYIINQKQHFFNAIIAGIYEGEPRWIEIDLGRADVLDVGGERLVRESIGVLQLNGMEKIFAIDGQHRVEGIRDALSRTSKHDDEECVVIFVAHRGTGAGLERTRRLFSTLNRYAKPVKLGEIIALDEDDAIAILTRRLLYHGPYVNRKDVIVPAKTKNLARTDDTSWTSVQALYDFIERVLLGGRGLRKKQIAKYKMLRRSGEELDALYAEIASVLNAMVNHFSELATYLTASGKVDASGRRGGKNGGSLLFRPIGMSICGDCLVYCKMRGLALDEAVSRLARVDRTLANEPWAGLLFDVANSKMRRATKSDLNCATLMWVYRAGLLEPKDFSKLIAVYSEAHEVSEAQAKQAIEASQVK